MNALNASLTDSSPSHPPPNPNLDPSSPSALTSFETTIEAAETSPAPSLHIKTPLLYSDGLSRRSGHNIFIKLDALQPSGSFKIRGVGRICQLSVKKYGRNAHLVSSSGGNAGLAAATAAKALNVKCTVFLPTTAEDFVKRTLEGLGAEVKIGGPAWDECDKAAREMVEEEKGAVYIHPFVGEDLVDGHSSIVHEIYEQVGESFRQAGEEESGQSGQINPDMIVCTVGGGGLIQGIVRGVSQTLSSNPSIPAPKIVSIQDFGADSFSKSIEASRADPAGKADTVVSLDAITSQATSMGAKTCSASALKAARAYSRYGTDQHQADGRAGVNEEEEQYNGRYFSTIVVEDSISGSAAWQFHKDHQIMVEMSCGAALTPAYQSKRILPVLLKGLGEGVGKKNIVLIGCGGSKVSEEMLKGYEEGYGTMEGRGRILVDGVEV